MANEVNYQPVSPDESKSCTHCKHFETEVAGAEVGKCFGHEVVAKGTCNFFESREKSGK